MKKWKLKLKWKIIFSIIIILLLIFLYMRFIGTSGLKVREYKIVNENISSFYGLKIVHFSDLHYGMGVDEDKLSDLIDTINKTKPDIVIFTGDLVDSNTKITDNLNKILIKYLSNINYTYGKYYVNGNHDEDNKSFDYVMTTSGFKNLNEFDVIYSKDNKSIFIGGVNTDNVLDENTKEALNLNNYNYKIFAMHYPDRIDDILKYNIDLIVSGHSHNGQVRLPIIGKIITPYEAKKYYDAYYKINNTDVYISGGIGNSVINLRLFNTPSFNLYRIVDK